MEELTIEQLQARLAAAEAEKDAAKSEAEKLKAENDIIHADNLKLSAAVNAVEEEKAKTAPVSFEEEDGYKYEFTCPTFTWSDGRVINVRAMANSKDEKEQEEFATMCAHLIQRNSGIIRRKED